MPTISVIVPIYRVEKYMDKCITSILAQTFTDIEVILVDDGSPDNCGAMCDEWAKKDDRIKVVHKVNGGLSSARNAGLDVAQGTYVSFIDSDDYILKNMLEVMHKGIVLANADMASCRVADIYEELNPEVSEQKNENVYDGETAYGKMLIGDEIPVSVCSKLYRRDVIGIQRFLEGRLYEDAFFAAGIMPKVNKVWVTDAQYYCYVHRKGSITTESFNSMGMDLLEAYKLNHEVVKEHFPKLTPFAEFRILWAHFMILDRILMVTNYKDVKELHQIKSELKTNWLYIVKSPFFNNSRKIGILMLKIHVCLYRKLVFLKRKRRGYSD